MKAAQINTYGDSEVVEITNQAPMPALSDGSLIVKVHAAGVNPVDWKIREGYLQKMVPLQFPATLGGDFSGVVVEVGKDVLNVKQGDEVYGQAIIVGGGSGSFAEFASTRAEHVARKPTSVSHTEASSLPLAGISALQALTEHMNIAKDQKILIHGGAGGIGSIAIQLAKHLGAYVAATARASDAAYVQKLGADEFIDYEKQSFEDLLHDYDAVFDTVGGETYNRSFKVLKKGGVIVSMLEQPNAELMAKHAVKAFAQGTRVMAEQLSKLAKLVNHGVITIHVDKTFPLEQAGEALEYLQSGMARGKIVVTIQ